MMFLTQKIICESICLILITTSTVNAYGDQLTNSSTKTPQAHMPMADVLLQPRTLVFENGKNSIFTSEITSGVLSSRTEFSPSALIKLQEQLKLSADGKESFPIESLIVCPDYSGSGRISALKKNINTLIPVRNPLEPKVVKLPAISFAQWFMVHHNTVYTVIRFILNGSVIGATLVITQNVPFSRSLLAGVVMGSMAAVLQYKIALYKDWVRSNSLASAFGSKMYFYDGHFVILGKKIYNHFLSLAEQYSKMGLTELAFLSIARLAIGIASASSFPTGFLVNAHSLLRTALQSTLTQGTASLGLFEDMSVQGEIGGWSSETQEIFRNTSALLLSAASLAVSTLELLYPGMSGAINLWIIDVPYGYAAIATVGIGFYLHAFFTIWKYRRSEFSWENLTSYY